MKRIKFVLILLFSSVLYGYADINTDKVMNKITRDKKTYISADVRAASEDAAYEEAMRLLSDNIAEYFKSEYKGETTPDAVYLSQLSSIYEKLTSQISNNRYRVVLYVKKADLMPMGGNANAVVLSKNENNSYEVVPSTPPKQIVKIDTVITVVEKPLNPTLSVIAHQKTREEIKSTLENFRKSNKILGAAAFPIEHIGDFYIVVTDVKEQVVAVLHCKDGKYMSIGTGKEVDPRQYSQCSAYWFTLP